MVNENILNFLGQFGGGQSQPLQSPAGFVQQQKQREIPPYMTSTVDPGNDKNDKLRLMLFALGGALKGDKDFVQNTLALQQMQEGKKKQDEQKKIYQDFLKGMEGKYDQRMIDFAKILPPDKGSDLLMSTFTKEPKERKTLKGAEGYYRYVDTGERVFPGVVKPEKEESPSQLISKQELGVLNKIKSLQDQVDAGTLILEEGEQITDKLNQYEKLILQSYISRPQQQDSFAAFAQFMSGQNDDDLIIKKVE